MAITSPNIYVKSGSTGAADGGTWTDAFTSAAGAAGVDTTTNNRIWVSSSHDESSTGANQIFAFAGTAALPTWVVCVDDTGSPEPPTAIATTAVCTTTGAYGFTITGNCYVYGITINCGSGAVNSYITQDNASTSPNSWQTYEKCNFKLVCTGSGSGIVIGAAANYYPSRVHWKDCNISFGNAVHRIALNFGELIWEGGSVLSGSTAITNGLIVSLSLGEYAKATVSGVDLSNLGSASYLVAAGANGTSDVVFRNCKLPASWTGGLVTGTLQPRDRVEMYNCDNTDTNYRLWIQDYTGAIRESVTIYNDAGADDGSAQGFSWEMVTTENAEFPHMALRSPEIVKWNDTTTGTLTATVEIVHNSQGSGTNGALRDDEIWLEVMCMDPGGTPVGKWQSDRCGNLNLNSDAADQASSSATWTGDSAGWDAQKLVVSFTPKEKGYVHARVMLAKASATVYVDPLLTIA